ncbi:glycosyltransferase family 4 protein [Granulosicoccus antarcticus]|uniref:Glycosyl transferase family 1 domain-containing protein n=1 Tax=Granulosicoccus antarcticus IMCC3135 TaxID=1192854 RepID=A0A2Z2P0A0_9GAMM|nr:glycosyltransferase family 4 protein [Granulosicoccus antarcticus]ASJ74540.1 hypothetical protein IMCC3135_22350 [Granulosicoccus antarcticus IMCC3135]
MSEADKSQATNQAGIKRVVFVQKFVPHYRLPLFENLREQFAQQGIEFVLIYGPPDAYEGSKIRMEYPEWGHRVKSLIIPLPGKFTRYLYWQGSPFKVRRGDVVIVEHASKLLDNYLLFALQQIGWISMCYFGHGKNFQSHREIGLARKLKQLMVRRVARWFAYTEISRQALLEQEVPDERIVVVNNTLTVTRKLEESEVQRHKSRFVYIGGLYDDKRLDLIFQSMQNLQAEHPELELVVAGTGPDQAMVESFASKHDWCNYVGSVFGEDRDRLLLSASAMVVPGAVGLVAIDSFHYAIPIITTRCDNHGPEVAYLENGDNALILDSKGDVESYTSLLRQFLESAELSEQLREGCRRSANRYTIQDTASKIVDGVLGL